MKHLDTYNKHIFKNENIDLSHMSKYEKKKQEFISSLDSLSTIDDDKIDKIFDYIGIDEYQDEEDAMDSFVDKVNFYKTMPNPVTLYRVVGAVDEESINIDKIGEHWTFYEWAIDGDMLTSIGDDMWEDDMIPFVIVASVPHSEIDVLQTIVQNLEYPNEYEINLKDNASGVKVIKIYEL